jgi:hypothetical protein
MSEQDRDLAQMDDEQHLRHQRRHALVQEAINEVSAEAEGRDQGEIARQLSLALEARGMDPQPPRWLEAVAAAASQGRLYVEDQSAVDPEILEAATGDSAVVEVTTVDGTVEDSLGDTSR